jgi:glycosidase
MDIKTLRALLEAGAVKKIHIVANGATIHAEIQTAKFKESVQTSKGSIKTWRTTDATIKWLRSLGAGKAEVDFSDWQPDQRALKLL